MYISDLRHRITFQNKVKYFIDTPTEENSSDNEAWTDFITVWAAIYPLKGSEFWAAQANYNKTILKFVCRYTKNLTPNMRITYNSRVFEIIGIIDIDEKHQWLQIIASEVV